MSLSSNRWQKKNSKYIHQNPWYRIRRDEVVRPDGVDSTYEVIETRGAAVFTVALTEEKEIYLIRLYRYTTDIESWEVPGGNSEGQPLLEAAKRELQEETGLIAGKWEEIGFWQTMNGICNETSHIFLATQLESTQGHKQEEEGICEVRKVPFAEAITMIKIGEITDGQTISAITKTALKLGFLNF